MKKKLLVSSIGAVVLLIVAGITPVVLAQKKTITKVEPEIIIVEGKNDCPVCDFLDVNDVPVPFVFLYYLCIFYAEIQFRICLRSGSFPNYCLRCYQEYLDYCDNTFNS